MKQFKEMCNIVEKAPKGALPTLKKLATKKGREALKRTIRMKKLQKAAKKKAKERKQWKAVGKFAATAGVGAAGASAAHKIAMKKRGQENA